MKEVIALTIEAIASAEKMKKHEVTVSVKGHIVSYAEPYHWEWLESDWDSARINTVEFSDGENGIEYIFTKGEVTFSLMKIRGM